MGAGISFLGMLPFVSPIAWRRSATIPAIFTLGLGIVAHPLTFGLQEALWKALGIDWGTHSILVTLYYPWQLIFAIGLALLFRHNRSDPAMPRGAAAPPASNRFGIGLRRIDGDAGRLLLWPLAA